MSAAILLADICREKAATCVEQGRWPEALSWWNAALANEWEAAAERRRAAA